MADENEDRAWTWVQRQHSRPWQMDGDKYAERGVVEKKIEIKITTKGQPVGIPVSLPPALSGKGRQRESRWDGETIQPLPPPNETTHLPVQTPRKTGGHGENKPPRNAEPGRG